MRLLAIGVLVLLPSAAFAHGGGLDRNGCHTNRKTGDYHCHGSGRSSSPSPATATRGLMTPAIDATDAATTDRSLVKAAQTLLRALGYSPTEFGTLDASTRSAIESFQKLEGLDRDGQVTPLLILRLSQSVASRCGTR